MKHLRGFTIVEIIIVITVIGILAGIGIVSYSGMQTRARDTERKADIDSVVSALETYYEQFGKYPDYETIVSGSFLSDTLRLSPSVLTAPGSTTGTPPLYSYEVIWALSGGQSADPNVYGYKAFTDNNTRICEAASQVCTRYELSYALEQENGVQIKSSKFGN